MFLHGCPMKSDNSSAFQWQQLYNHSLMEPFRTTLVRLINQARVNPIAAAERLYNQLEKHYEGDELHYFDKHIQTFEGIAALKDYKLSLMQGKSTKSLITSDTLNKVAQAIAEEKGRSGRCDHELPPVICEKIGVFAQLEGKIGELIALKAHSSQEIAAYFLIDDGSASRKRRRMLLDQKYEFIGIGTAFHRVHDIITVILLSENIIQPLNMASYRRAESKQELKANYEGYQ